MRVPDAYPDCVFASHLPVLEALDPQPERVLEFGVGFFSTAAFLEMPTVKRLTSVEMYSDWRDQVRGKFGKDPRWTLLDGEDKVPALTEFDLVFVDDGRTEIERIGTIVRVLSEPHPKVVIHDAEFHLFRDAIVDHADCDYVIHSELTPYTAVVEATA